MQEKSQKTDKHGTSKEKSFLPSKKLREKIFTSMFKCIENDMHQSQIASYLSKKTGEKWSKQRVHYWISRLEKNGLVKKIVRSSVKKYACSEQSKKVLGQCERSKNYDLHNIIITLPIMSIGSLPEGNINMGNWKYKRMKFGDFTVNINYGKDPKLMIYPPKVYGDTIDEVLVRCGHEITIIAVLFEKNYGCRINLDKMIVARKPHMHAMNDPVIKQMDKEKVQYSGNNIEFNRSGDAHADILGFEGMSKYDQLLNAVPKMVNTLDQRIEKFSENIASHLALIQDYRRESVDNRKIMQDMAESLKNAVLRGFGSVQGGNTPGTHEKWLKPGIEQSENENLMHIEALITIPGFLGDKNGSIHKYPEIRKGCNIWLEKNIARTLIKQKKAIEI